MALHGKLACSTRQTYTENAYEIRSFNYFFSDLQRAIRLSLVPRKYSIKREKSINKSIFISIDSERSVKSITFEYFLLTCQYIRFQIRFLTAVFVN